MAEPLKLLCYLHEAWAPTLEPASARRAWMDQTPENFAYRCLPLSIANSHGWVALTPRGFWTRWTGADDLDGVEIRPDDGAESCEGPVSMFGHGVLSFHVPGIFRTPQGVNLFLSGPPNHPIDAISPLTGVIETDWSPYSFTMNWKFTRPNHWVRFEKGQPFAFFFPVPRGYVESFHPEFRALSSEPQLAADFAAWDRARRAFQAEIQRDPPADPAAKWQKRYYRGLLPQDERKLVDHQIKLRVAPFQGRPAPKRDLPPTEESSPAAPPSPDCATLLRRRDWLLRNQERHRRLASDGGGLIRVEPPTRDEFLNEIYAPGRPAVLDGLVSAWPATRWTPESLGGRVGDLMVEVQTGRNADELYERRKAAHRRTVRFAEFLKHSLTASNDTYLTAYNSEGNRTFWASLQGDLGAIDAYLNHDDEHGSGFPWIGGAATFTPLHHDLTNNLLVQLVGEKSLILVPPSETANLFACEGVFSELIDLDDPVRRARFPLANAVEGYRVDLSPGDAIFIPVGWWHQVRSRSFSVSVTYTCFRWPNDAHEDWPG